MKLSFSNIGWAAEHDEIILPALESLGFEGLEIAPTRIFPEHPYDETEAVENFAANLKEDYHMTVCSMQSIWYGRSESLFGTDAERQTLLDYTEKAFAFAKRIGCKSLVFGCPRNRNMPEGVTDPTPAEEFFKAAGTKAVDYGCVLALEANPPIYNTNYLNTTAEVLQLAEKLNLPGIRVNLDVGTMLQNQESVSLLKGKIPLISHVHISEPYLAQIEPRDLHSELASLLCKENYDRFVSVEMKAQPAGVPENIATYLKEVFG